MGLSYAEGVFNDKNPIKRWLQRRRLFSAVKLVDASMNNARVVVDFGAGNGELCKLLVGRFPNARIICYEPAPWLLAEAKENLKHISRVEFCSCVDEISQYSVDVVFCLEVFEHIPLQATEKAMHQMRDLLHEDSLAVIGVPVEIGVPALYKGLFRMSRRFGAYDASPKNVLLSTLGMPPKDRPLSEIAPGITVHHVHTGFDHRAFRKLIANEFTLKRSSASPFHFLGTALNPEAYFVVKKNCTISN